MCSPRRSHQGAFTKARSPRRVHQGAFTKARSPRRVHQGAFTNARSPRRVLDRNSSGPRRASAAHRAQNLRTGSLKLFRRAIVGFDLAKAKRKLQTRKLKEAHYFRTRTPRSGSDFNKLTGHFLSESVGCSKAQFWTCEGPVPTQRSSQETLLRGFQNKPVHDHRKNAETHGTQVWETTDKGTCGLVLGYVTLIQFVARDKDRGAHGQAVCERSKIATARRNRRHLPPTLPASARRKKSPAFRETWCSQKSRCKKTSSMDSPFSCTKTPRQRSPLIHASKPLTSE